MGCYRMLEIPSYRVGGDGVENVGSKMKRSKRSRCSRYVVCHGAHAHLQLVPPLILAHPLPLLPMLALLPYNFLPAGVVFFIPILCVLTILSSCAHIVIVYLAW